MLVILHVVTFLSVVIGLGEFVCFSDVCSKRGYYECSETERRCKECATFYTDTCGTAHQPAGCYGYCADSINKSLHAQLQTEQEKIINLTADYRGLNDTNEHLRDVISEYNYKSQTLEKENQDLESRVEALNKTDEEMERKNLISRKDLEENRSKVIGLTIGLSIASLLVIVLIVLLFCFWKKRGTTKREADVEQKIVNANHPDANTRQNKTDRTTTDISENEAEQIQNNDEEVAKDEEDINKAPTQEIGGNSSSPSECVTSVKQ